jgi:hypothetical protein
MDGPSPYAEDSTQGSETLRPRTSSRRRECRGALTSLRARGQGSKPSGDASPRAAFPERIAYGIRSGPPLTRSAIAAAASTRFGAAAVATIAASSSSTTCADSVLSRAGSVPPASAGCPPPVAADGGAPTQRRVLPRAISAGDPARRPAGDFAMPGSAGRPARRGVRGRIGDADSALSRPHRQAQR